MKLTRELHWGHWEEFHHHTLICLLLMLKQGTEEDEHRLALVLTLTGPESPRDKCLVFISNGELSGLA